MAYAEETKVPVERTKAQIEQMLVSHGCDGFATAWEASTNRAAVQFSTQGRLVRFELRLPTENDPEYRLTGSGRVRAQDARRTAHQQAVRSRWRGLLLCIRAKIEAVEAGIETFEEAFLPHLVVPGGRRFGEHAIPAITKAYETGEPPDMGDGAVASPDGG